MRERSIRVIEREPQAGSYFGRPPPWALDAQRLVIQAAAHGVQNFKREIVMTSNQVVEAVRGEVPEEAVVGDEHAAIWKAILGLATERATISLDTIVQKLRSGPPGIITAFGEIAYDGVPFERRLWPAARLVFETWTMRRFLAELHEAAKEGYGDVGDRASWMAAKVARLQVLATAAVPAKLSSAAEGGDRMLRTIGVSRPRGAPTGIERLDEKTGGLHPGDFVLVTSEAATTGGSKGGKTSFVTTIAANVAEASTLEGGGSVYMSSLELDEEELIQRFGCGLGMVNWHAFRRGLQNAEDEAKLRAGIRYYKRLPVYIDDTKGNGARELAARLRRAKAALADTGRPLRVAVIDYVQLIDASALVHSSATLEQQLKKLGYFLIDLAKELGIAILGVAATNDDGLVRDCRGLVYACTAWWTVKIDAKDKAGPRGATVRIKAARKGEQNVNAPCWFHPSICWFSDDEHMQRRLEVEDDIADQERSA